MVPSSDGRRRNLRPDAQPRLPSSRVPGNAKAHTGDFFQGQTNASYNVVVSNYMPAATSGMVTVIETAPAGMTLVSMAGTGWTCPGTASNNCSRNDVLAGA